MVEAKAQAQLNNLLSHIAKGFLVLELNLKFPRGQSRHGLWLVPIYTYCHV